MAPSNKKTFGIRQLRILLLLIIFLLIALFSYLQQQELADWSKPVQVTIYPINGNDTDEVANYISTLNHENFNDIAVFLKDEAQHYGIESASLVNITLGKTVTSTPPPPPAERDNRIAVILWSLKLRYWMWRNISTLNIGSAHVRIFVVYHAAKHDQPLEHSYGLRKGLVGVVNAFALPRQAAQNKIIIAHELLHTLGASDKYDQHGMPIYPQGFADTELEPLLPQYVAEIMAGRIPLTPQRAKIPRGLEDCLIGPETAREIKWLASVEDNEANSTD